MITIAEAKQKDVPLIVKMWKEFQTYHCDSLLKRDPGLKPHLEKKCDAEQVFWNYIQGKLESRDAGVLLAYVEGKPAGYCIHLVENTLPIFKMQQIGYIGDLYVREPFRGKGVSTMLRDNAFIWFRRKGLSHVSIKIYPGNARARAIYEKWGFAVYHTEMRRKL